MKMKSVLGIDLGTSSVKILQVYQDGTVRKQKAGYTAVSPEGWEAAVWEALSRSELETVEGIGLSSQVGTYIVDGKEVIGWDSGIGARELAWLKERYSPEDFAEEISMPHPDITSYPLPRLKYIQECFPDAAKVCQPKDLLCERLTGNFVTDPYSWRGLTNISAGEYSRRFLDAIGFSEEKLPRVIKETEAAGCTRAINLGGRRLPEGIPVFTGLNDYFSALLGMGVRHTGDMFDISGTSEHLGVLEEKLNIHTKLVSGPYLDHFVHYGVTASSGISLEFGLGLCGSLTAGLEKMRAKQPPVFLPYLNGERAPLWYIDARGMFFGISADCSREELGYAVLEGVVFSLYHIYETMGLPGASRLRITGGAAVNPALNRLKAEMFGLPADILEETDSSALGAAAIAAAGAGWFKDPFEAAEQMCRIKSSIEPEGRYTEWLRDRFSIYKELYPAVKKQFQELRRIK